MDWMTFPALALPGLKHGFSLRAPAIPREQLDAHLRPSLAALGYPADTIIEGEQTHGNEVAFVRAVAVVRTAVEKPAAAVAVAPSHSPAPATPAAIETAATAGMVQPAPVEIRSTLEIYAGTSPDPVQLTPAGRIPGVDALVTRIPRVPLVIRVADCGPIFFYDPVNRAIAVAHSGRKGTEANIAAQTVRSMQENCGTNPADLIVQLGPCIRPPHYEVAFAEEIGRQARAAGVIHYHDCLECTGCNLERYYSYRLELGKTGRMWGALMLEEPSASK